MRFKEYRRCWSPMHSLLHVIQPRAMLVIVKMLVSSPPPPHIDPNREPERRFRDFHFVLQSPFLHYAREVLRFSTRPALVEWTRAFFFTRGGEKTTWPSPFLAGKREKKNKDRHLLLGILRDSWLVSREIFKGGGGEKACLGNPGYFPRPLWFL